MPQSINLISFTRVTENEIDPEMIGSLDYAISSNLAHWIVAGGPAEVEQRKANIVREMRDLAGKLERGESPFTVTLETVAEKIAALAGVK